MPKLPYIRFFPADWLQDNVAGCSLAAQGLWLRMMFIMHRTDRYGYLTLNGAAMQPDTICRMAGCTPAEYDVLLDELMKAGVPSVTDDGIIFSRRMVRDERERNKANKRQTAHRKDKRRSKKINNYGVTPIVTPFVTPFVTDMSRDSHAAYACSDSNTDIKEKARARWEKFWKAYPKKVGESSAMEVWDELNPDDELTGVIVEAIREQISAGMLDMSEKMRFCPNAARWLREKRWTDVLPETPGRAEPVPDANEGREYTGHAEARRYLENTTGNHTDRLQSALSKLQEEINEHSYREWIAPLLYVAKTGDTVVLFHEHADWVEEHYRSRIARVLKCDVRIVDDISDFTG